jgi:hypothetical protein
MDKTNGTIISSGVTRRYLLYCVPKICDRSKAAPLVISMHPGAAWPAVQMNITRWNGLADEHGFIVVYPAGMGLLCSAPAGSEMRRGRYRHPRPYARFAPGTDSKFRDWVQIRSGSDERSEQPYLARVLKSSLNARHFSPKSK